MVQGREQATSYYSQKAFLLLLMLSPSNPCPLYMCNIQLNLLCTMTTRIHDIYHPRFLLHLYSSTCMGIGLQRDDAKCVKICCWVTCVLLATIKDVLQAFEKPENKTRMYEIRQEAGGDLVKLLQYQLLFAASVQQEVIKRHGFSDNGEGTNPCLNHLSINSLQSNLNYPDSLGPNKIVRIIEGPDNWKYEY